MLETIFTDNFPEVSSAEELQKIVNQYPNYDPYYIASGCTKERKEKFDGLWRIFKPIADKNFLAVLKRKNNFHQRTWEMYLGAVFIKNKLDVSSLSDGPDFVINKDKENKIFIEATAYERGTTENKVPEMFMAKKGEKMRAIDPPYDKLLLRLTNSLDTKSKRYKNFIEERNQPYIIAINGGKEGLDYPSPEPLIFKCLFGLGNERFKKMNDQLVYAGWTKRDYIKKENGKKIPMIFFEKDENKFVSAVIYSSINILNSPQNIGSDCIMVHNPKAKCPVDTKTFSFLWQWKAEYIEDGLEIKKIKS